jgi:hypothetical protein
MYERMHSPCELIRICVDAAFSQGLSFLTRFYMQSAADCNECRNFLENGSCVEDCPLEKYPIRAEKRCLQCHAVCEADNGCTGGLPMLGTGGCNKCSGLVVIHRNGSNTCLPATSEAPACDNEHYLDEVSLQERSSLYAGHKVCKLCDQHCDGCLGSGPNKCKSCLHYKQNTDCVETCLSPQYAPNDHTNECERCSVQCRDEGCYGKADYECNQCPSYFYMNAINKTVCTETCPEGHRYSRGMECVEACSPEEYNNKKQQCLRCHMECEGGCNGEFRSDCVGCKNVISDGNCLSECPKNSASNSDNECLPTDAQ